MCNVPVNNFIDMLMLNIQKEITLAYFDFHDVMVNSFPLKCLIGRFLFFSAYQHWKLDLNQYRCYFRVEIHAKYTHRSE